MKKYTLFIYILLLSMLSAQAQPKFLPKFVRKMLFEKDSSRSASFFLLPVVSSAPETGLEVGASTLYSFYTDKTDKSTRVSNIFAYGTLTTEGQQRVSLSTSYWLPQNRYHYLAGISFINFPFNFYGIGNDTRKADEERIGEKRLKINFTGEKRLSKYLYAGYVLGGLDYRYNIMNTGKSFEAQIPAQDRNGGASIYAGPTLTFDTRNNNTYTTKGFIINTYLNVMHGLFGDNNYKGSFFDFEYAQFIPLQKRLVLGINFQEQSLLGNQTPFYLLPELGNDEMMRGYYNGRYRDRNMIAAQTELRYRLSDRLGIAAFAGTGTVFHNSFRFNKLKPNYGGGLRYFFDTEKGLSMRVDYGIGEKRPGEPRQSGFYMSLGEAF
ncbi:BamA/TamA family outer membrane protein [Mucilaginibacter lacusdianchii]|uniref:BamA/TamA family outer membrane protein n=1 Tax=Mucilaginibacter lacusdianchii TaxID=2684211 RepID=UPI00131D89B6|nr:BamA/TamA family outer membrane protein [Mucilaginibacter sp. JXJ CY 39]